jgi:hypothetical protein
MLYIIYLVYMKLNERLMMQKLVLKKPILFIQIIIQWIKIIFQYL